MMRLNLALIAIAALLCSLMGCASAPLPGGATGLASPLLKQYKHLVIRGYVPGMQASGVSLEAGDPYTIIATGSVSLCQGPGCKYQDVRPEWGWPFMARVGMTPHFYPLRGTNGITLIAKNPGELHFAVKEGLFSEFDIYGDTRAPERYHDNVGHFDVHVFVWKRPDYPAIAQFFDSLKAKHTDNVGLVHAALDAREKSGASRECMKASMERPNYKLYEDVPIGGLGYSNPTGICVSRGATVAVLVKGSVDDLPLWVSVGADGVQKRPLIGDPRKPVTAAVFSVTRDGLLFFHFRGRLRAGDDKGRSPVSVLVWEEGDGPDMESDLEGFLASKGLERGSGNVWIACAQYFSEIGDYARAESIFKRFREDPAESDLIKLVTYFFSAMNELEVGKYERAASYARRASEIAGKADLKTHCGLGILLEARALSGLGRHQEALEVLKEASSVFGGEDYWQSHVHLYLGHNELAMKRHARALDHLQNALIKIAELDVMGWRPELYLLIGEALLGLGRQQEAVVFLQRAVDEGGGLTEIQWRAHGMLGRICESQGDDLKALRHYEEAIKNIESVRERLSDSELGSVFIEDKYEIYERMIRLLMRRERCEDAFHYVERSRARLMLDMIRAKTITSSDEQMRQMLSRERRLRREIELIQRDIRQSQDPRAVPEFLSRQLDALRQEHLSVVRQIEEVDPEMASLVSVNPVRAEEIQEILGEEGALLEYFMGEEVQYVFVVTGKKVAASALKATPEQAFRSVQQFRASMDAVATEGVLTHSYEGPLAKLYEMLILPVEKDIQGKRHLIVAPHGVLHYLPFHALLDRNRRYLLESFSLSYVPSGSVLKYARLKNKGRRGSILAVGNPSTDLDPLPAAEQEVRKVSALFSRKLVATGAQATETLVKRQSAAYDVLLLSTHGEMVPSDPLRSNLRLAPSEGDDGRLTVAEIFDMELKADLVTLSACETALARGQKGEFPRGDDLVGLSRAFLHAGAPSVLGSLWKVSDDSTVELISAFYRNLGSMHKAEALRKAQLQLMKTQVAMSVDRGGRGVSRSVGEQPGVMIECSHPFFWAPFVLIGEWN